MDTASIHYTVLIFAQYSIIEKVQEAKKTGLKCVRIIIFELRYKGESGVLSR